MFAEVGDASSDVVPSVQDVVTTNVVRDEGLTHVDLPAAEDVSDALDAGIVLDTSVDVPTSQDVLMRWTSLSRMSR